MYFQLIIYFTLFIADKFSLYTMSFRNYIILIIYLLSFKQLEFLID